MKKQIVLAAGLAVGLSACISGPLMKPTVHIESPTPAAAAALTLDERIAIQDAWKAIREGRTERAQKILAKMSPDNPFVAAGLGYVALVTDDLAGAEDYLLRSLETEPDLTVSYLGLGQIYQKTNQDERAHRMYLEVLKRDPENEFARNEAEGIAEILTGQSMDEARRAAAEGDSEKSKSAYLRALEFSPRLKAAHVALARQFIKEKDFHTAYLHLKAAGSGEAEDKDLLREFADALFQSGQWSRSLDIYEEILVLDPEDKEVKERVEQIKNRLGVVELPDQFEAIASSEAVTKEDVAALIGVRFRAVLADLNPRPPIIVDVTVSWAQRYIVKAAALGIMEVYANHNFQPKKIVNRAEMAQIVVRLIDVLRKNGSKIYPQIPLNRIQIADVPQEHFFYLPIAQAVSYQVMDLASDRTFKPDRRVNGREATRIFELLAGLIE